MPLNDNETPGQAMKRIEGEMRSPARPQMAQTFTPLAGAQRGMEGYSANVGAGVGPLSAMGLVSADKETGAPTVAGGRVGLNAGPVNLGYIHMQPAAPVKPVQGVQLNVPFDADSYFGVQATKTPGGNQYGVNVGKGGLNAYGSYNPTRRDLSAGFQFERRFADGGPVLTSKRIASSFVPPEEQGAISPSMEGVIEGAQAVGRGLGPALQATGEYITSTAPRQMLSDVGTLAGGMYEAAKQNPAEFIGGMLPGIGNIYSLRDIDELKGKIAAARNAGDEETALKLEKFVPLAAVGAAAPFGAGAAVGAVTKAAERAAVKGAARELSPIGLYSYGAEAASMLPQAKGTPEQMAAMLTKQGVKPVEMEGFTEAFAGKQSITAEEASQFFKEKMPVVEEVVLGKKGNELTEAERYRLLDFNERKTPLSAEEIVDRDALQARWVDSIGTPTKFGQYTLPGGENYREVLLKMPEEFGAPKQVMDDLNAARERAAQASKAYNEALEQGLTGDMQISYDDFAKLTQEHDIARARLKNFEQIAKQSGFSSQHWDDPNVLAHIRMSDRTGPNGEKILHVEEIQSDWAQKGRKEGFKDPEADARRAGLFGQLEEIKKERTRALSAVRDQFDADKAEFEAAYKQLMLQAEKEFDSSRMRTSDIEKYNAASEEALRQTEHLLSPAEQKFRLASQEIDSRFDGTINALEEQFNALPKSGDLPSAPYVTSTQAWTDLALKRVLKEAAEGGYDKVVWTPGVEQAKRYSLNSVVDRIAYNPATQELQYVKSGSQHWSEHPTSVEPKDLPDLIGKEAAEALMSEPLTRGKHDLELENLEIGGKGMKGYYDKIVPTQLAKLTKKLDPEVKVGMTDVLLPPSGKKGSNNPPIEAPGITITPKMREAIMQGLPNYAEGGKVERPETGIKAALVDLREAAKKQNIYRPKLAYLIRQMGGADHRRSQLLANNLLSDDLDDLVQRLEDQPRAVSMIKKLTAKID